MIRYFLHTKAPNKSAKISRTMPTQSAQLTEVIVAQKLDLPADSVSEVLKFCDRNTFIACSLVCKQWFAVTLLDMFWNIPIKKIAAKIDTNETRPLRNVYIALMKLNAKNRKQEKRKMMLSRTSKSCIAIWALVAITVITVAIVLAFSWVFWVPMLMYLVHKD
jgi:hypothetical protein